MVNGGFTRGSLVFESDTPANVFPLTGNGGFPAAVRSLFLDIHDCLWRARHHRAARAGWGHVTPGQSSVRNGTAGRPARLARLQAGLLAQA